MKSTDNSLVSAVIVTAGKGDYLKRCLDSLYQQSELPREVIVIDNSRDKSFRKGIITDYPQVKMYSCPQNLFYAQAMNLGIAESKGGFVLCLNDDVTLSVDFIESALKGFSAEPKIGMVSGKILRSDKTTIDSTGLFLSYCRSAKERGYGIKDNGQYEKEGYVFGVNGAVAFYRREMLDEIKEGHDYFDSGFGIFYEDLDISWRANRRGWKAFYLPRAVAYHVRGGSVRPDDGIGRKIARHYLSDKLLFDLIKNRYLTMIKNETVFSYLLHLPGIVFYDFFAWLDILFFRPRLIKSFILQRKHIKSAFKKRKTSFSRR